MAAATRELVAPSGAKEFRVRGPLKEVGDASLGEHGSTILDLSVNKIPHINLVAEGAKPFGFQPTPLPDRTAVMPVYDIRTQEMPPIKNAVDGSIYPTLTDNGDTTGDRE